MAQVTVFNPAPGGGISNALTVAIQATPLSRIGAFSQVASGNGWKTTLTLVNATNQSVNCRVNFYSDSGTQLILPLILPNGAQVIASAADFTVPTRGSVVLESESSVGFNVGWAEVKASGPLGGYAIFRQHVAGIPDSEGTAVLETSGSSS